ncbi:DegV family protein [Chloroflexota bacterium]
MTSFAIVTDSTADLPVDIQQERQIYIAPLHVLWGTDDFEDGVDITRDQFFDRLATDPELPTTSQPTPAAFVELYKKAIAETGAEGVLVLTISAHLSGTYASAIQAGGMVDFPVEVVDLRTVSIPTGLGVLKMADARDEGASLEEAVALARTLPDQLKLVFALDTMKYLHKGGRIGGGKRLLGAALNIKPILHIEDGKIDAYDSVRTRKRVSKRLIEILADHIDENKSIHIAILHSRVPEEAEKLKATIEARWTVERMVVTEVGSVIGVHVGPGALGFALLQY